MSPFGTTAEAMGDALRLSRGMTYKAALAGLALGGGKAVILGDPKTQKSEALFRAFGAMVEGLAGITSPPRTWAPRSATWTGWPRPRTT